MKPAIRRAGWRWAAALCLALPALGLAQADAAPRPAPAPVQPAAAPADAQAPQEQQVLEVAQEFSRRCAEKLESWVVRKEVTIEQLFAFLYYSMPKTDPPKFTTDWDRLADRDLQAIEDAILARSPSFVFAVLVDWQGYLPTHNQRYSLPLTGNLANDLVNNRTKRIFNDRTGLLAARSEAPFLVQKYQRDTGEAMVDLSVPVTLRGQHWGAVRIGYRPVEAK